ncbi:MAG: amidohydrolase family protein [Firmicutes bacterium]|nr:amidohydrolase family protein [Bacillota bacterium]
MDLIVRNALLRNNKEVVDIAVKDGVIQEAGPKLELTGRNEIDALGKLVTPTFIDPHIHLDKILISEVVRDNITGTLMEAIEIIWEKKKNYELQDIIDRSNRVIEWAVKFGTTKLRTHVDVDTIGGLKPLEALLRVKEMNRDLVDLQIVAFPQEGIIQDPGTKELMEEAMKLGADVVGGMPYNEMEYDDSKAHIDFCFELAKKYDADIDMHVDETDDETARTLQYYAAKTIKEGWEGRVTAGHTCALAAYNPSYAAKIIALVRKAKMNMITNPATNLMLQGRFDKQPIRRGITRVKELVEAGVNVAYGQDCIKDTFYPTFGQADLLEVGQLVAHAAQFSMPHEVEKVYDMPTINSAKILRWEDYGIEKGKSADFNIIDAPTIQEALRTRADRLYVIRKGKVIARTKTHSEILR